MGSAAPVPRGANNNQRKKGNMKINRQITLSAVAAGCLTLGSVAFAQTGITNGAVTRSNGQGSTTGMTGTHANNSGNDMGTSSTGGSADRNTASAGDNSGTQTEQPSTKHHRKSHHANRHEAKGDEEKNSNTTGSTDNNNGGGGH